MRILEFIDSLKNNENINQFINLRYINCPDYEILIYMKMELSVESEIFFFSLEQTEDNLVYQVNAIKYIQLFPLEFAVELVNTFLPLYNYDTQQVANRMLQYRIKDA